MEPTSKHADPIYYKDYPDFSAPETARIKMLPI